MSDDARSHARLTVDQLDQLHDEGGKDPAEQALVRFAVEEIWEARGLVNCADCAHRAHRGRCTAVVGYIGAGKPMHCPCGS